MLSSFSGGRSRSALAKRFAEDTVTAGNQNKTSALQIANCSVSNSQVRFARLLGGAEMTTILSENYSRILAAPQADPLEGGRGVIAQNYCHCLSWEKATTIKMRISKMLFILRFRPTIKFQGGSPVDPLFEPPCPPPFDSTSQKLFLSSFRRL